MPTRVLHLVGSPTDEFFADLSRLYARGALAALTGGDDLQHLIAHVEPGGRWRFPTDLGAEALAAAEPLDLPDALTRITALAPDVAVPHLFCRAGMTSYRALLDVIGLPFVGNRAETMAIGAHKPSASALVARAGVAVPQSEVVRPGEPVTLSLPVVVKPADGDNSAGLTLVRPGPHAADELAAAVRLACEDSPAALVETYVELGREVRCGVLERGGELVPLPLEEYAVDPHTKPVRDAADKLARTGDGDLTLVAKDAAHAWIVDVDDPVTAAVWQAAVTCHRALGCRHYSLFDFRIDPTGRPVFLEAGLYCSFAPSSVVATMAAAAGIGLDELFAGAVAEASGCRTGAPGA